MHLPFGTTFLSLLMSSSTNIKFSPLRRYRLKLAVSNIGIKFSHSLHNSLRCMEHLMPRNLVSLNKNKKNQNINIHYDVSGSVVSIISPGIKCLFKIKHTVS